ncbi:MAG: beta-ketoacyl-[acyl-carrier-protein] synthase family protein, partial [Amylibacter sp.]
GGARRAILAALQDAKLNPEDIGYINAHGTGTTANDKTETLAIKQVFQNHSKKIMVSSTKSMHGHLIGGTGAVELLACIAALKDGMIAPTIGYQEYDPNCDLDVVPNEARQQKVNAVISNAFAFGGLNAVIALSSI